MGRAFEELNQTGSIVETVIINKMETHHSDAEDREEMEHWVRQISSMPEVHQQDFQPGHEIVSIVQVPLQKGRKNRPVGVENLHKFSELLYVEQDQEGNRKRDVAKARFQETQLEGPITLPYIPAELTDEEVLLEDEEEEGSGTD